MPLGCRKVGEFQAESLRVAASCAALALWRPGVSGMGAGMSRGRRRGFGLEASRGMLSLLALQVLLEYGRAGASRPPVTAALLAANTLIYLRPGALCSSLLQSATHHRGTQPLPTYPELSEDGISVHASKPPPIF